MKHYLLKTALAFMAVVCGGISSYAAPNGSDDEVAIQNASFDANPEDVITVTTQGYERNIAQGSDQIAGLQPVTGWTAGTQTESDPGYTGGVFAYGSENLLNNKIAAPAAAPEGIESNYTLALAAVWGGVAQYTQDITLSAGDYKFTYVVYNGVNTGAVTKNLFGFITEEKEYLSEVKTFTVGEWATLDVTFKLTEETAGKLSVGFIGSGGSGNAPHLFVDHVKLTRVPAIDAALAALKAAIADAQTKADSYAIGEVLFTYAASEIEPLRQAIATAQAAFDAAESKEAVEAATATLNAFVAAFAPVAKKPDTAKEYVITNKTAELTLSIGGEAVKIAEEGIVKFTEVEGGWVLSNNAEVPEYILKTSANTWTLSTTTNIDEAYKVNFNLVDGAYTIQGANGLFGTDNITDGSAVYANKAQSNNGLWTIAEYVAPEPVKTDYTEYIVNADLKGEGGFDATGTKGIDGSGIVKVGNNATFDFKQTIANLPAGKYKVTAQAAYRYSGSEQAEYDAIQAGTNTKLASLYATVGEKTVNTPVQNRYDGASETDLAGNGAVQVNNLWVPNSSSAVQAWFNAGKYVNEVEFNLAEDGAVTIGIVKTAQPEAGDYTVLGPWTLTRLGDADVEPEPQPEPTPEPGTDMTDKIVNPSFETGDLTGWTVGSSSDTGVKPNSDDIYKTEGCDGDYLFNTWWQGIPITQTVTNLANGKYELKALMTNDAITAGNKPCLYLLANGAHSEVFSSPNAGTFAEGSMQFYVTNGTATIGAIGGNADGSFTEAGYYWYKVDNFRLTFVEALPNIDEIEIPEGKMSNDALAAITAAKEAGDVVALLEAVQKAKESIAAYAKAQAAIDAAKAEMSATNVYTAEAFNAYKAIYDAAETKYNDGTLIDADAKALENPEERTAWQHKASILIDDLLLSAWNIGETKAKDYETALYINTWSSEGEGDGTNFLVPFFEYWTGDDDSLGENTLTATISDLQKGIYDVTAWVRVRMKNGVEAPAYGITLQANDGEAANVSDGEQVGAGQFYLKDAAAQGEVGEDGVLNIKFTVAADNNISWLSFKNVKYAFNETATGIQTVNTVNTSNTIYTLSGQKVEKAVKGLYIIGGKKVVVK